jgi:hypothetical protein
MNELTHDGLGRFLSGRAAGSRSERRWFLDRPLHDLDYENYPHRKRYVHRARWRAGCVHGDGSDQTDRIVDFIIVGRL